MTERSWAGCQSSWAGCQGLVTKRAVYTEFMKRRAPTRPTVNLVAARLPGRHGGGSF
ncbi:hypothetical protein Q0M94_01990 [Deinococcus radiomollis]|uniref:hypothetical protein n=1 Tax=Deinococcus radiomollis TaxID=468916 RepID=UPI00389186E2